MKPKFETLIGIGDLMVVKQCLARYEPGEIAHIENVMATETRGREHRRLHRIEEIVVVEEERTEESKRDLQTTERFELQQESQVTIQSDTKFEAGAEVSASYGPVQIGAFARFSTSQSQTESNRNATNYAKEIVERSLNRLVERVREERTTRTLEEFEEKNEHRFENTSGDHVTGVYRWVDKYYRAKVINYGKRLFYEFIVPEPAAFYIFSRTHDRAQDLPEEPEYPVDPDTDEPLEPGHVTRDNYLTLISLYGAPGATPPPAEEIVINKMIARELQIDQHWAFVENELEIPEGYRYGSSELVGSFWHEEEEFQYSIFRSTFTDNESNEEEPTTSGAIDEVRGIFPLGARGFGINTLVFSVAVRCVLTEEAEQDWQLKTFSAIMSEYNKKVLNYEEKLAAARVQEGVEIRGNNPLINRTIEREELKKGCITLWTGFKFNAVPGITHDEDEEPPDNYPEIQIDNSFEITPEIQFLEGALDWKNITYWFYPYYWARKDHWLDIFPLQDEDPLFADFLRAGSARVLVPVHLAASEAVLYYQLTGSLWTGGGDVPLFSPPSISGTITAEGVDEVETELGLYNSYLAELSGEAEIDTIDEDVDLRPEDPETWLIKVPTTLVWLQEDATLPDLEA
jgi:hypothetical protein